METTWGYLIVAFLGVRADFGWQEDCNKTGIEWMNKAIAYRDQNDLHGLESNLLYVCEPPAGYVFASTKASVKLVRR